MSKDLANEPERAIKRRKPPDKGLEKQRPSGPEAGATNVLRLQQQAGNRALQRLLASQQGALLQRQPPEEEEEIQTKPLTQRQGGAEGASASLPAAALGTGSTGFELDDETAGRINHARGGGQALEAGLQAQMGETLGYDFSGVRVHTGRESDELNRQLSARAFTTGQDIFFRSGDYNPASSGGRELIAHELSHVVQQGTGRVPGGGSGMTVRPSGDAFEQESDALAREAANAGPAAATTPGGEGLQRQGDEEEELQMMSLQRQEDEEIEEQI